MKEEMEAFMKFSVLCRDYKMSFCFKSLDKAGKKIDILTYIYKGQRKI